MRRQPVAPAAPPAARPPATATQPVVLAARLYVVAILVFAVLPTRSALEATVGDRQTAATLSAHFLEFLLLGVLVTLAAARRRSWRRALGVAAAAGAAVALGTEVLQWVVPWRSFEVRDLAVDLLGLGVGLALVSLWRAGARAASGRRA